MKMNIKKRLMPVIMAVALLAGMVSRGGITHTNLHTFTRSTGYLPQNSPVVGSDGSLYGTALGGGALSNGVVWKLTQDGIYSILHTFLGGTNGDSPYGGLLRIGNEYYGTTRGGGVTNYGVRGAAFKIDEAGAFTSYALFTNEATTGSQPQGTLTANEDGSVLYGTTYYGGHGGQGTVFALSRTNNGLSLLWVSYFEGTNGYWPVAGVTLGPDGKLYGVTSGGGTNNSGVIFRLSTNGGPIVRLRSFTGGADGSSPQYPLVLGRDGNLYGTSQYGSKDGALFKIGTNGVFTLIRSFENTNNAGEYPQELTVGDDGAMYGITDLGGSNGVGVLFRLGMDNSYFEAWSAPGGLSLKPFTIMTGGDGAFYCMAGNFSTTQSIFRVTIPKMTDLLEVVSTNTENLDVSWFSVKGEQYTLKKGQNATAFTDLVTITATNRLTTYTDPIADLGFYVIGVNTNNGLPASYWSNVLKGTSFPRTYIYLTNPPGSIIGTNSGCTNCPPPPPPSIPGMSMRAEDEGGNEWTWEDYLNPLNWL